MEILSIVIDFFLIIGVFVWLADLYASGGISPGHAIFTLFALTITLGGIYSMRRHQFIRDIFEIAFVIATLLTFLIWQKAGDLAAIAWTLFPLIYALLAVFVLYLSIGRRYARTYVRDGEIVPPERSPREQHLLDFFILTSLFVWLAELHADGLISLEVAVVLLVVLAVLLGMFWAHKVLRAVFEISVALLGAMAFLIWQEGGDLRELLAILPSLLVIFVTLFGFYVALRGVLAPWMGSLFPAKNRKQR